MSELTLQELLLRTELLTVVRDGIDELVETGRSAILDNLRARYEDDGTTSMKSKLPDGTIVAGISLSVPKPKTVVDDEDALTEWAKQNEPSLLVEHVIPAQPARFVPAYTVEAVPESREWVLDPKRVTELLARVKPVDKTGGPVADPDHDGLLVDGVSYKPGERPKQFSIKFEPDGRESVALAYQRGGLSHLVGGTPLPAIEAAGGDQ